MRLSASYFGIVMNAGPASVRPYELMTDACGIRSCSFFNVAGASGALPIDTATGPERSASANLGLAGLSSALAGPRRIIIGLARSTTPKPGAPSNLGLYNPERP